MYQDSLIVFLRYATVRTVLVARAQIFERIFERQGDLRDRESTEMACRPAWAAWSGTGQS